MQSYMVESASTLANSATPSELLSSLSAAGARLRAALDADDGERTRQILCNVDSVLEHAPLPSPPRTPGCNVPSRLPTPSTPTLSRDLETTAWHLRTGVSSREFDDTLPPLHVPQSSHFNPSPPPELTSVVERQAWRSAAALGRAQRERAAAMRERAAADEAELAARAQRAQRLAELSARLDARAVATSPPAFMVAERAAAAEREARRAVRVSSLAASRADYGRVSSPPDPSLTVVRQMPLVLTDSESGSVGSTGSECSEHGEVVDLSPESAPEHLTLSSSSSPVPSDTGYHPLDDPLVQEKEKEEEISTEFLEIGIFANKIWPRKRCGQRFLSLNPASLTLTWATPRRGALSGVHNMVVKNAVCGASIAEVVPSRWAGQVAVPGAFGVFVGGDWLVFQCADVLTAKKWTQAICRLIANNI